MKKFLVVLVFGLMIIQTKTYSQVIPSIYAGWGLGTNIGGEIGIGTEIKYKMISFNAAIGSWIGEFPSHTGAKSRFDYDFGVKIYSRIGVFLGVNYGIIGSSLYTDGSQMIPHFDKTHGFSFTLGYRHTIYKKLYGLGFMGISSNKNENYIYILDDKEFIPRIGLILGYEFRSKN